jgi:hypothetical protein
MKIVDGTDIAIAIDGSPYVTPSEEDALFETRRKAIEAYIRKQYDAQPNRHAKRAFLAKLKRSQKVSRRKAA